jgi:hypothetical protein
MQVSHKPSHGEGFVTMANYVPYVPSVPTSDPITPALMLGVPRCKLYSTGGQRQFLLEVLDELEHNRLYRTRGNLDYKRFCQLIDQDEETERVDFKIQCDAFNRKRKANAELVKDIIALANNGYVSSHLIIGVSDDRKQFKSVDNQKLIDGRADDRIQRLCRDNIFPIPKVKLIKLECSAIPRVRPEHRGKTFIIIQVGPQIRQCFRFNTDFIDYKEELSFRKNEVWIRRMATSDIAAPEEIKRLLEGHAPIVAAQVEENTDYTRLHRGDVHISIVKDFQDLMSTCGVQMVEASKYGEHYEGRNEIDLVIRGKKLRLVVCFSRESDKYTIYRLLKVLHNVAHGLLWICVTSIRRQENEWFQKVIKEPWGFFCLPYSTGLNGMLPVQPYEGRPFCLALPNVSSTQKLHNAWGKMIDTLSRDTDIAKDVSERRLRIDAAFSSWLRKGCKAALNTSVGVQLEEVKAFLRRHEK